MIDKCKQRFDELVRDCSEGNWDSYQAKPLSDVAVNAAMSFVDHIVPQQLQETMAIVPGVNGDIDLSWHNERIQLNFTDKGEVWLTAMYDDMRKVNHLAWMAAVIGEDKKPCDT